MVDVCVIGHITRDIIRIKNVEKELPGGVAYYFPMAVKSLGANVSLITKCAEKDKLLLNDLVKHNVDIYYSKSRKTTTFKNIYPEDLNSRVEKATSLATPFRLEEIPHISARYFHFGPLSKGDIPVDLLRVISEKSKVSLDIQGCLRTVEKGTIRLSDWQEKDEGLTYVNILKADEDEAKVLSGEENIERAAERLATYRIDEIVITLGRKGSLIFSKGEVHRIPSFPPKKMIDPMKKVAEKQARLAAQRRKEQQRQEEERRRQEEEWRQRQASDRDSGTPDDRKQESSSQPMGRFIRSE